MKTNIKKIYNFNAVLLILLAIVFYTHKYILIKYDFYYSIDLLVKSYLINLILASFIYTSLILLKKKYNEQIGFLFMAGSLLKFAAFFIFINPYLSKDTDHSRFEFTMFFIPYIFSLLVETIYLIKVLNASK